MIMKEEETSTGHSIQGASLMHVHSHTAEIAAEVSSNMPSNTSTCLS